MGNEKRVLQPHQNTAPRVVSASFAKTLKVFSEREREAYATFSNTSDQNIAG